MTGAERRALTIDRFRQWEVFLEAEQATPILIASLTADWPPQLIVTTLKDVETAWLCGLLEKVTAALRNQNRQPLEPISAERMLAMTPHELCGLDLCQEIQDVLAALGVPIAMETIRAWSPSQTFEAMHYARAMQARRSEPVDVPGKPAFIR